MPGTGSGQQDMQSWWEGFRSIAETPAIAGKSRSVGVLSGRIRVVAGGGVLLLCCCARTFTRHVPGEVARRHVLRPVRVTSRTDPAGSLVHSGGVAGLGGSWCGGGLGAFRAW